MRRPPRRLLIVKFYGMGDSVLVRSIVEQLRKYHPQMDIGLLVGPATREVMTSGGSFRVHLYDPKAASTSSMLKLWLEISARRYDGILNFEQGATNGAALLGATNARFHVGFVPAADRSRARFLSNALSFHQEQSMWQSFVRLARFVEPNLDERVGTVPLPCDPQTEEWIKEWWNEKLSIGDTVVALHIGSFYMEFKRWPMQRYLQLANELRSRVTGLSIILTGSGSEAPIIREFVEQYAGHSIDASGLGSIQKTAAILKRCDLLVSNDTGVMHLGAAMGTPTVGLFGPVAPRHWAPIGPRATFVYETRERCSPCVDVYSNRRPTVCTHADTGRCMWDIDVPSVLSAARRVIRGQWLS